MSRDAPAARLAAHCFMRFTPPALRLRSLQFAAAALLTAAAAHLSAAELAQSQWAYPGPDGRLEYKHTENGDRIMDFSYAGYHGGGVALPDVPVKATVKPSGGDDTAVIQAAIDHVSALPLENGFRGAVLLAPGTFPCDQTITISASGVVLRGSGSDTTKDSVSTLKLTGKPHPAIVVRSGGGNRGRRNAEEDPNPMAPRTKIADAYVPSGTNAFSVVDAKLFAVGDTILIEHPVTAAWIKLLGMDDLVRNNQAQTWIREGNTIATERRIAAIAGNRLTVDVPLSDNFDAKYLNPPGTTVAKITPPARLSEVGIEHLHIESPRQEISHTQPHFTALRINGRDCWARDVAIDETMNSVGVGGERITLQQVSVRRKARHQGASKPAEFAPNASQVLLDRCSVTADNVWYIATGAGVAGPIVVLNCTFLGNGRSEAHQRWSTGMLYDNCRAPDGGFEMRNRGEMGSGHGWAMGWGVFWNCVGKNFLVQNPPGSVNWMIGCVGPSTAAPRPFGSGANLPGGIEDSVGKPVAPRSLYLTQLADRLGPQALKNIGYTSSDPASGGTVSVEPIAENSARADRGGIDHLGRNLALDRPVLTSNTRGGDRRFAGWQALDEDDATCWATDDGKTPATLEIDTEGATVIDAIELREAAGTAGQVKGYKVEGFVDSAWKVLAQGTAIGERKVDHFPKTTVWKVRLTLDRAAPYVAIAKFGVYNTSAP
jgi:hypothetical protein